MDLTPKELARYSRHLRLNRFGKEAQERLKGSSALIVGLGGLGSPAALYLAAAGVGRLGLADFDTVAEHNLQRQILHDTPSVGETKWSSAKERLNRINPHVTLEEHPEGITVENALSIFSRYDIIVDGSDNFPTRYLNNDAAVLAGKPLVYGSVFQFDGQVALFDPARGGACYRCLFPEPPEPETIPNCDEAGVLGALCGVVGSLQALEAIKYLGGVSEPSAGSTQLLLLDSWGTQFDQIQISKNPECPVCAKGGRIQRLRSEEYEFTCAVESPATSVAHMNASIENPPLEIDIRTAKDWLEAEGESVVLVDVREPFEVEICQIDGSLTIPMGQVPERLSDFSSDKTYVIQCHHGSRSLQVTEFLRHQGFSKVTNMAGGIDAWAAELEPSMARY
ncbi:MAG: molybdopterin-synthase adenylyltransferase MoeB [Verrucomicrobiota bacterium]